MGNTREKAVQNGWGGTFTIKSTSLNNETGQTRICHTCTLVVELQKNKEFVNSALESFLSLAKHLHLHSACCTALGVGSSLTLIISLSEQGVLNVNPICQRKLES
jgi:hypothetical protein